MSKPHGTSGLTTIEMVIVLLSLVGLHLVAISAGTAAETSSVAANLARARMEEMLSLAPEKLKEQHETEVQRHVPSRLGRTFTVHTTVVAPHPVWLDLTGTVSWQLTFGAACASAGPAGDCAGSSVTYTRTLQTRVHAPAPP